MIVRKATYEDIDAALPIFAKARLRMRAEGNMEQWSGNYPAREALERDIERGCGHVCEEDGRIVAYFAFIPGIEPTYARIEDGSWPDDDPYCTIHRIAASERGHGIFHAVTRWAMERTETLRIDTHKDNATMLHLIEKEGFAYCGIIYVADGPRLAFQLRRKEMRPED